MTLHVVAYSSNDSSILEYGFILGVFLVRCSQWFGVVKNIGKHGVEPGIRFKEPCLLAADQCRKHLFAAFQQLLMIFFANVVVIQLLLDLGNIRV